MFYKLFNIKPFNFSILLIILFNIFLITSSALNLFDQCLNLLLSIGIFEYFKNKKLNIKNRIRLFDIILSLFILFFTLYGAFLTYGIEFIHWCGVPPSKYKNSFFLNDNSPIFKCKRSLIGNETS